MHEAGIAASILEIAERTAVEHSCATVRCITVRLGEMSGVAPEALEFSFEALKAGTRAAEATMVLEHVPLMAVCPKCGWTGAPARQFCFVCPQCDEAVEVLTGFELQVQHVDIE